MSLGLSRADRKVLRLVEQTVSLLVSRMERLSVARLDPKMEIPKGKTLVLLTVYLTDFWMVILWGFG